MQASSVQECDAFNTNGIPKLEITSTTRQLHDHSTSVHANINEQTAAKNIIKN
jgi:hypothetical protein